MKSKQERYNFRREKVRAKLSLRSSSVARLSVHKSLKFLYAQVIDDNAGKTLASATTLSKDLKGKFSHSGKSVEAAKALGALIAKKAVSAGVKEVCFDRGGRLYHGTIKALAESARAEGLKF